MDAHQKLAEITKQAFSSLYKAKTQDIVTFAEENFFLVPGRGVVSGLISLLPWQKSLLQIWSHPSIKKYVIMKSAQSGLSTMLAIFQIHTILKRKLAVASFNPTKEISAKYVESQIDSRYPYMECLSSALPKSYKLQDGSNTVKKKLWNNIPLYFDGATKSSQLSSITVGVVTLDEVSQMGLATDGGDVINLAMDRTRTFPRGKLIALSTPRGASCLLTKHFKAEDIVLKRYGACPHCNQFTHLSFESMIFSKDKKEWLEKHECEHCQGEINFQDVPNLDEKGIWKTEDDALFFINGKFYDSDINPCEPPRSIALHIPVFTSIYAQWQDIADDYRAAKRDVDLSDSDSARMGAFYNTTLALPFTVKNQMVDKSRFKILSSTEMGNISIDRVFMGIDYADRHLDYSVLGVSFSERQIVILDMGEIIADFRKSDIIHRELEKLLAKHSPAMTFLDTGYKSATLYDVLRQYPNQIRPIKGVDQAAKPISKSIIDKNYYLRVLNSDYFKTKLKAGLENPVSDFGISLAPTLEAKSIKSLSSEERVQVGQKYKWKLLHRDNHQWDATYLALASAEDSGVFRQRKQTNNPKPLKPKLGKETQKKRPSLRSKTPNLY